LVTKLAIRFEDRCAEVEINGFAIKETKIKMFGYKK